MDENFTAALAGFFTAALIYLTRRLLQSPSARIGRDVAKRVGKEKIEENTIDSGMIEIKTINSMIEHLEKKLQEIERDRK
jgi:hypothetical protein